MAGALALAGIGQALAGWVAVRRFAAEPAPPEPATLPPVLLLKPLHGDEPMLEAALATACAQNYPALRIVCGVQDPDDPAIAVVRRLQARFPALDLRLVIDPARHGGNRKVENLINMLAAHSPADAAEVLVVADSDMHTAPDWLRRVVAALAQPGVGLVTTLYTGLPAAPGAVAALGCTALAHTFLPGVLLARVAGRQDCLGATMALRAGTLAAIGGLAALLPHLADDNALGRLVRARGLGVALAASVPQTTVAETRLGALLSHELRWARTIRALVPAGFAASAVQYPIGWALLSVALSWHPAAVALLLLAWAARGTAARGIDRALDLAPAPLALLPLRDVLSMGLVVAGFTGRRVRWRGREARA